MNKNIVAFLAASMAVCFGAHAYGETYFLEAFNTNPPLAATQAPGVWYVDRYAPAAFESASFGGDNRLRLAISAADGANSRPASKKGTFYNTQGRKFDLGNGFYTSIRGRLYVGSDWNTELRRSDIWGTLVNASNVISGYPIIGIAKTSYSGGLVCRVYSNDKFQNGTNVADWVDVTAQIPGGIVTNAWYDLEIKLKPGAIEYYVNGILVFTDNAAFGSTKFSNVIIQGYNFNDPALPADGKPALLNDSYDIFWDDITAGPSGMEGVPVDLNGSYRSPNSGTVGSGASGIAVAATIPIGFGTVYERSGTNSIFENVVNGTFTPFNDLTKAPNNLFMANANGTSFEADVKLDGSWKPFQFGGSDPMVPKATGDTFGIGWIGAVNTFGIRFATDLSGNYVAHLSSSKIVTGSHAILDSNGSPATLPAGTTRVRVNASVVGGMLTGSVMPLDGPAAYQVFNLGSTNGSNMNTNSPWTIDFTNVGFFAGFETHENQASKAGAYVSNFNTNAIPNALYVTTDDPYVRSSDASIDYRVGQANLGAEVSGYQVFMQLLGGQGFASGLYQGPYQQFFPATIGSNLDFAGAGYYSNQMNGRVASIKAFPGALEAATGINFEPAPNLFSSAAPYFSDIPANVRNSNVVLVDNTPPAMTSPVLGGSSWVAPNAVVGTLTFVVDAKDVGTHQSGLDVRPYGVITWSNGSTTSVTTSSEVGNNFVGSVPITSSTPSGPATLSLTVVDRAGNSTTKTVTFNVSTVNVTFDVTQVALNGDANRVIEFRFGGSGGSHAPVLVRKVVNFNTPVVVGATASRKGTVVITMQDLDLADDGIVNNSVLSTSVLTTAYVKDPFFSLAKMVTLSGASGNYTGSAELLLGDLTNNNVINVADLAVWTMNNGTSMSENTTLGQAALPRQANIDGIGAPSVGLADRNIITTNWLMVGDSDTSTNFRGGDGSLTLSEFVRETGIALSEALKIDTDGNGTITRAEVLAWVPSKVRR